MVGERAKKTKREITGLVLGMLGMALATAILKFFQFEQFLYNVALVFIVVVLLIASRFGLWPGIAISILGFLSLNYFFITPFGTLYIDSAAGVVAVVSFLVAAFITSEIAARARRNTEQARLGQQETSALNQVNVAVLGEAQPAPMLEQVVRQVTQNSEASFAAIYTASSDTPGQVVLSASYPEIAAPGQPQFFSPPLIDASFKQKEAIYEQVAGQGRAAYLPLLRGEQALGVLLVFIKDPENYTRPDKNKEVFDPQEKRWFQILANQAALAVDHAHLIAENALVASLKETDRLKSVLLGLVSHELRTPITAIKTAVAGLKDASDEIEPDELNEYLEIIDQESERLSRLISNLLDLSRIEAGHLTPDKGLYYLPEIIGKTIDRLNRSNTVAVHPVETCYEDELPLVPLD
jgi:two-component system sensor histidine kinase KdpD